jgi:hypothetical protein
MRVGELHARDLTLRIAAGSTRAEANSDSLESRRPSAGTRCRTTVGMFAKVFEFMKGEHD